MVLSKLYAVVLHEKVENKYQIDNHALWFLFLLFIAFFVVMWLKAIKPVYLNYILWRDELKKITLKGFSRTFLILYDYIFILFVKKN